MWTDGHGKVSRHIFAIFCCERAKNKMLPINMMSPVENISVSWV
jgi:hypothetical protein